MKESLESPAKIEIIKGLVTRPVPRDTKAPWLDARANKVILHKPFVFKVNGQEIVVPETYITDFSSIPRGLWWVFPPSYSEARHGAVAHDYLYSHLYRYYSKKYADQLLREFMRHNGAGRTARTMFYLSTRAFGGGGWKQLKEDNPHPHWLHSHEKLSFTKYDKISAKEAVGPFVN